MSEILLPPKEINREVREYGMWLSHFAETNRIAQSLLVEPDHLVFKAQDPKDFENKVKLLKPWAEDEKIAFAQIDWRFLAAAQMVMPLALDQHRYVDWIEVIETKDKETRPTGADYFGLEYADFYFPNYGLAADLLDHRHIHYERRKDRNHRWLNIPINSHGQTMRISDTKLIEIVETELEDGTAKLI